MGKFYTDQERYEYCRKYKISGLTKREFAEQNGINRHTLGDWINAYNNIHGKFINVSAVSEKENEKIKNDLYELVFLTTPHPSSALYEAINYTKNCWKDLFTYQLDGHIEMTNNTAERAVKPFVIQRKVFQTSGSYAGARFTTKLFSIIQTANLNNINVEKYLNYVFNNINIKPIDELLPYSKDIAKSL